MATRRLVLASELAAFQPVPRSVTAVEVEAGLPAGEFTLSASEVAILSPGFTGTAFLKVMDRGGVQLQVLTHWQFAFQRRRYRSSASGAWSAWGAPSL